MAQVESKTEAKVESPTGGDSKSKEDTKNMKDWGSGKGNHVEAHSGNDKEYIQVEAEKKEKMVTNTVKEDLA